MDVVPAKAAGGTPKPTEESPTVCPACGKVHAGAARSTRTTGKEDAMRPCTGGLICPAAGVERLKHLVLAHCDGHRGVGAAKRVEEALRGRSSSARRRISSPLQRRGRGAARPPRGPGALGRHRVCANSSPRSRRGRSVELPRFVFATRGIRHVGETGGKLLARHFHTFEGPARRGPPRRRRATRRPTTISSPSTASAPWSPTPWWSSSARATTRKCSRRCSRRLRRSPTRRRRHRQPRRRQGRWSSPARSSR